MVLSGSKISETTLTLQLQQNCTDVTLAKGKAVKESYSQH